MAVLVLQTTTFGSHGGIQTYNRFFCRVLNELTGLGERRVLIGTDEQTDIADARNDTIYQELEIETFGRSKAALARRVLSLSIKTKIDLIIAGHVNYAPLAALVKRLQPSTRYGVVIHGVEVWSQLPRMKRQALRRADFITSVSEYTRRKVVEVNNARPEKVHILHNTVPWDGDGSGMKPNQLEESIDFLPQGTRLLSVCRLDANEGEKGVDSVIRSIPRILAHVPDLHYIVIGEGTDLKRHKRLASETGIAGRVHFLGSVDESTLRRCYQACDIFVLPSAQEGFGIVFLEAMHHRKPIVAARYGGIPEVVKDGQTGFLVEYGNLDQLANVISRLCLNSELRANFGKAGYEHLRQNFTFEHFRRKLTDIILSELPGAIVGLKRHKLGLADTIT